MEQVVGVILGQMDITIVTRGVARQAVQMVGAVLRTLEHSRRPLFQTQPVEVAGAESSWLASHQESANNTHIKGRRGN